MATFSTNSLTCDAWASQDSESGKNGNGSIFFEGTTIYSYGYHFKIANYITDSVVLLTTDTYSNTTSAHVREVIKSLGYIGYFFVPNVAPTSKKEHGANFEDYKARIADLESKAARARKNKDFYMESVLKLAEEANLYADTFKLRHKRISIEKEVA